MTSPESYTPKHLAEKILTSKAALEGERKQVTALFADLKGSMELFADRDPEEARQAPRPGDRTHDGGRAPLRGHRQPCAGRRHRRPVRGAARARGPRGACLLRRAPDAGDRQALRGRCSARRGDPDPDPRRPEFGRGRRALDRQRSQDGLHRRRSDHERGRPDGADGCARVDPDLRRHPGAGRGLC